MDVNAVRTAFQQYSTMTGHHARNDLHAEIKAKEDQILIQLFQH
jgi:hypothetical protein